VKGILDCKYCGNKFLPESRKDLFCSAQCKRMYRQVNTAVEEKERPRKRNRAFDHPVVQYLRFVKGSDRTHRAW